MIRNLSRLSAATAVAAMLASCRLGAGARRQRLQLVRLHRRVDHRGVHQGDRHQGRLRRLRFQRNSRDQASGRRQRLRHRRSDRSNFLARQIAGRRLPEARQVEAAQSLQHVGRRHRARRQIRSGQRILHQLHVGHHRHRLQHQEGARKRSASTKVDSWDVFFKPEKLAKLADCGVYVLDSPTDIIPTALNYLGLDPESTSADDFAKAEEALMKRPAVHPQVPLVRIHQRAGQWRHLPRRRLFGRRLPGARPRRRGRPGRRRRLRHPEGRRGDVVRSDGDSRRRPARRGGARVPQLHDEAGSRRQGHPTTSSTPTATRPRSSSSTRRSSTIRRSIRTRRRWRSSSRSRPTIRRRSALVTRIWTKIVTGQ